MGTIAPSGERTAGTEAARVVRGVDGQVLGRHEGIAFYTPGQASRTSVLRWGSGCTCKRSCRSRLRLLCRGAACPVAIVVGDLRVFDEAVGVRPGGREVKIRYASPPSTATLSFGRRGRLLAHFHQPQRALSPGQSAVFYAGDRVLGNHSAVRGRRSSLHRRCGCDNGLSRQVL